MAMKKRILKIALFGLAAFMLGYLLRGGGRGARSEPPAAGKMEGMQGMSEGGAMAAMMDRKLTLTPAAEKLAEVRTVPVRRKFATAEIQMVGKVDYDETRLGYITAWVPGRIDDLYVDYTGVPVQKGDHMVYLYSPDLVAAQEELIQASKTLRDIEQSQNDFIKGRTQATLESAREKLRLLGLTAEQVRKIETSSQPEDHLTIYAPMSGIVIHLNALEGMYVKTGTRIYTIADLSSLWVVLDAYESDLPWLRYGQKVEFETEAYPGEIFEGRISFIDPVLNAKTRTVRVRVNVPNPLGELKPEMFVRATVKSNVALAGRVMDPSLAGKWIGPMHPEIIRDEPGTCPICGSKLVTAKSMGYLSAVKEDEMPLIIPASAPLLTGKRAVVYVKDPDQTGVYEGRVIELGPRAGNEYIVKSGLKEGELVVAKGNFKIDSAIQIQAKPSMMNPEGGGPAMGMGDMDM